MSDARNAGENAIWFCPAQPSAEIVRVECAKFRRECDLAWSRATLCGDHACRVREMQARVRFGFVRRNPLRRSCVSRARNAGESAILLCRGQPAAEIVCVECAKCRRECDRGLSRAHPHCHSFTSAHHRLNDGIRGCRKKGRDVDVCLLHLHDKRCAGGTHESLILIVTSFALRSQCWWFEGPVRESGADDLKRTYCILSVCLILEVRLTCFEPLLAGYLLAACFWDQDEARANPFCVRFDLLTVFFVLFFKWD